MTIEHVREAIGEILLQQTSPMKEFDLIQLLQAGDEPLLQADALRSDLSLFQTHFLVFHCLYSLQDEWLTQRVGQLQIEPLCIFCHPYEAAEKSAGAEVQPQDPLRDYYLNWSNCEGMSESGVEALLNQFWRRYARGPMRQSVLTEDIEKALHTLECETSEPTLIEVKRQYRLMVHRCHPDKGGDVGQMQQLQEAYELVCRGLFR
ncbi:MAG: molecular chaperone DnaJ [Idiomarina sp.]|nr:molecular chaperone DnaJ [Idiomarina sp.]